VTFKRALKVKDKEMDGLSLAFSFLFCVGWSFCGANSRKKKRNKPKDHPEPVRNPPHWSSSSIGA